MSCDKPAQAADTDPAYADGLTKLFNEVKVKDRIADLSPEYRKFCEWLRIE